MDRGLIRPNIGAGAIWGADMTNNRHNHPPIQEDTVINSLFHEMCGRGIAEEPAVVSRQQTAVSIELMSVLKGCVVGFYRSNVGWVASSILLKALICHAFIV